MAQVLFTVELDYDLAPQQAAAILRPLGYAVLLDGAAAAGAGAHYSYLCAAPTRLLVATAEGAVVRSTDGTVLAQAATPFELLAQSASDERAGAAELPPFRGGWAGYIGYDCGAALEGVVAPLSSQFDVPDAILGWYSWVLAWDHARRRMWLVAETGRAGGDSEAAHAVLGLLGSSSTTARGDDSGVVDPRHATPRAGAGEVLPGSVQSNFTRSAYMSAVDRAVELILAGDIFQVNLSQRFTADCSDDPWELYRRLSAQNPASHSAFLEYPGFSVLSVSPELFLQLDADGLVRSCPIKGTRPRGNDQSGDAALAGELLTSAKDRAENLMIVDLLRNDLSRVCESGSVRASELFRLERLSTVQHLVSAVEGRLRAGMGAPELLRAAFPGGSITGAPKVRAMQIIASTERYRRNVYCGSIGYIGADGVVQLSIAIRTMLHFPRVQTAVFSAGGGIVADSDPAAEYAETLAKAWGIASALALDSAGAATT